MQYSVWVVGDACAAAKVRFPSHAQHSECCATLPKSSWLARQTLSESRLDTTIADAPRSLPELGVSPHAAAHPHLSFAAPEPAIASSTVVITTPAQQVPRPIRRPRDRTVSLLATTPSEVPMIPEIDRSSDAVNRSINSALAALAPQCHPTTRAQVIRILVELIWAHGMAIFPTFVPLVTALTISQETVNIYSVIVVVVLILMFFGAEGAVEWARAAEIRYRCLREIERHVATPSSGFQGAMVGLRGFWEVRPLRVKNVVRDGKICCIRRP